MNGEASSRMASGSEKFLTRAEMRKIQDKEDKEANETCFDFLREDTIKDADGRRPDDPDYDKRTVYIPKASWEALKPFEKQFWGIKRNHFDTILFFQKGKFFELYENDAQIGHTQFDLKLTDRVKMKMVGISRKSPLNPIDVGRSASPSKASIATLPNSSERVTKWERSNRQRQRSGERHHKYLPSAGGLPSAPRCACAKRIQERANRKIRRRIRSSSAP